MGLMNGCPRWGLASKIQKFIRYFHKLALPIPCLNSCLINTDLPTEITPKPRLLLEGSTVRLTNRKIYSISFRLVPWTSAVFTVVQTWSPLLACELSSLHSGPKEQHRNKSIQWGCGQQGLLSGCTGTLEAVWMPGGLPSATPGQLGGQTHLGEHFLLCFVSRKHRAK